MKNFDVVIVGAGPAGSATAIGLARLGYEVALVDKKAFPREKLCGDFVNPINWAVFRDLGVEDRVLAEPHGEVTGFRITNSSGREAEVRFGSARSPALDGTRACGARARSTAYAKSGRAGRDDLPGTPDRETFRTRAGLAIESREKKAGERNF